VKFHFCLRLNIKDIIIKWKRHLQGKINIEGEIHQDEACCSLNFLFLRISSFLFYFSFLVGPTVKSIIDAKSSPDGRGVQMVALVQTEIIIYTFEVFFGLSSYQNFKNIKRINQKSNKSKFYLVYLVKPKLYYLKRNKHIESYKN
jgi:hypothetical protein